MIKGLSDHEKFKLIRPMIGESNEDIYHLPIITKADISAINWNLISPIGFKSCKLNQSNKHKLIHMFTYDKDLERLWNEPLRYVPSFSTATLIGTPDYSAYPSMNPNLIRYNVFRNRWLGKIWQNYGCRVIPTIQWCMPDTYDICFGGVEAGSCVLISTLGCQLNTQVFLDGFQEMKRRLQPELIVVIGSMISGMTGRFVNYKYIDTFSNKYTYKQPRLPIFPAIFEIKEVM